MKRSKEQIKEQILEVCKEPAILTAIVYQCNLNFRTAKFHLESLIDAGLIDVSGTNQISYKTTPRGIKALKHISAFRSLLKPVTNSQDKLVVHEGL
jgi:predicted transcriptional regulator